MDEIAQAVCDAARVEPPASEEQARGEVGHAVGQLGARPEQRELTLCFREVLLVEKALDVAELGVIKRATPPHNRRSLARLLPTWPARRSARRRAVFVANFSGPERSMPHPDADAP